MANAAETVFCKQGLLNIYAAVTKKAYKDLTEYKKQQAKIAANPGFKVSFNYRITEEQYYSARMWLDEVYPEIEWMFEKRKQESSIQLPAEEDLETNGRKD